MMTLCAAALPVWQVQSTKGFLLCAKEQGKKTYGNAALNFFFSPADIISCFYPF
jgi:hypothetical protein